MQACLPRELRDLIYDYIWDDNYHRLASCYMSPSPTIGHGFRWTTAHMHPKIGRTPRDTKPIVINPAYVDLDTAREALEAYYRISAHHEHAFLVRCPEQMHTILHEDAFKLGVLPAEHLRAMDLYLTQERSEVWLPWTIDGNKLSKAFTQLTEGIRRKKYFKLSITFIQTEIRLKQWDLLFRILVPLWTAFEAAGAEVHLYWHYTRALEQTDMLRWVFSLDHIVSVWTPELEWKKEIIEHIEREGTLFPRESKHFRWEDREEEEDESG